MTKPVVSAQLACDLLKELYGIDDAAVHSLYSMDDCNFRVSSGTIIKGSRIDIFNKDGYVLKILNTSNSGGGHIDGEHVMMNELLKNGVNAPEPIIQNTGVFFSLRNIDGSDHAVRLLKYVAGNLLASVTYTDQLGYSLGRFLSNFHVILAPIKHKGLEEYKSIWLLSGLAEWDNFLEAVDPKEKEMLTSLKVMFEKEVSSIEDSLPRGPAHGDFNDHNILADNEQVTGIIDFGDAAELPFVYDLGLCVFYMLTGSNSEETKDWIRLCKVVLKGYESNRKLEEIEKKALPYCILGRFFQSFTIYWYALKNDELSEYLQVMTKRSSLPKLEEILKIGVDNFGKMLFD